jgi:AraC family transcriptional activator of pobA
MLFLDQQVPVYSLTPQNAVSSRLFELVRTEGALAYRSDVLIPHRKDYYMLVFVRRGGARHWVDMTSFVLKDNGFYFSTPGQLQVKEAPQPAWVTSLAFTREFLALQQNAALAQLPLLLNPQNAHELLLTAADVAFVEDMLAKLEAEYQRPSEWQQRMLTAYLTVLLTYLSRLYTEQFPGGEPSADQLLLQKYRAKIAECFRELHEVGAYAALLRQAGFCAHSGAAGAGSAALTVPHPPIGEGNCF